MEPQGYSVGIIGYGSSARTFHIPFIKASPLFHLHSILQRQVRPYQPDAGQDLHHVKIYQSLDDFLQDRQISLVIITTPPNSHFELAAAALNSNKHVIVEKPFTPTFSEAEALIRLARRRNLLLTVYQNRRWDADFLTLKALKNQGTFGRIVEFESHFDRYRPIAPQDTWKSQRGPGNSALYDLGTHLIDQVVHLFGMPEKVTGFVGSQRIPENNPAGLDDSFTVLLHYKDDMLATIKAGVISPEQNQLRFWVRGDCASYRKYGFDPQEGQLKRGMRPTDPGFGDEVDTESGRGWITEIGDGSSGPTFLTVPVKLASTVEQSSGTYARFYHELAIALKSGKPEDVPVAPEQAAQVIKIIELAQESSKTFKTMTI